MRGALGGLPVWLLALVLAWTLPGVVRHGAAPPPFPVHGAALATLAVGVLALVAPLAAALGGPGLVRRRSLALLEAPPDLLWGALALALWPAAWGPPGPAPWLLAFLGAALPGEVRWLAQALPAEHPFPAAWGPDAQRRIRRRTLRRLAGPWLAARLPVWLTATLVLERLLGLPGLGTDWMTRVELRDRQGLAAWVVGLALLWLLSRTAEEP